MDLPVRIDAGVPTEPVLSVDGAWDAPGLNLSHWPGNRTPRELRHDLSTGSALAFGRLPVSERARLAAGCTAIQNNHFDTDGTCAIFALVRPELALARAERLCDAAAAGDFFRHPSDAAFAVDRIVAGAADPERSPIAADLAGRPDGERHTRATLWLMERLDALADGDLAPYRDLWEPDLERLHRDIAALARAERTDLVHLDWTVWTGAAEESTEPGRHALFGAEDAADRVLVCAPRDGGWTYRFLLSTVSWFDLQTRTAQARPDLEQLAADLNETAGTDPAGAEAWRAQPVASASPELWFGAREHPHFAEHTACLRPSALAPARVREALADALRGALLLPE